MEITHSRSLQRQNAALQSVPETMAVAYETAVACRTADQALAAPTMHQLIKAFDYKQVFGSACAIVTGSMLHFAANRRLEPGQVSTFAEQVLEDFTHESLADLSVFMRRAAMGNYDEGETYGALDIPRMGKWWRLYLTEKSEARERAEREAANVAQREAEFVIGNIPGLSDAVAQSVLDNEERKYEDARRRRMARLALQFKFMTDEDLRASYVKYKDADTRSVILEQAKERGLLSASMNEAVRRGEEEARAEAQHLTDHPEELPAIPEPPSTQVA